MTTLPTRSRKRLEISTLSQTLERGMAMINRVEPSAKNPQASRSAVRSMGL